MPHVTCHVHVLVHVDMFVHWPQRAAVRGVASRRVELRTSVVLARKKTHEVAAPPIMPDGTSWRSSTLRPHILDAACNGSTDSRKEAFSEITRRFTVPKNNEFAKQNLLELWEDDRFHEVLRRALAPGTPDLLLPTVMVLIIHLTFHEDVVVTIWANQEVRAALLSAARLLDRTDTLAVDEPGRASTRLEALTALHNLTFAQDNLAPLWQDEELRSVVVAAAASTCREDRQYKEAGLKMLSNFLLEPSNLVPMQQHAPACAALEAAARTKGKKEMLRAVNTALEKLGRSTQPQPPPAAAALAEASPGPPSAHLSGEQEAALPAVAAPSASLGEVGLGGVGVAAEAETRWEALLEDFEEVEPNR